MALRGFRADDTHEFCPTSASVEIARKIPKGPYGYDLIPCKELAMRLTIPESWVREHTRTRSTDPIPHIRLGKYVRFLWGSPELEQWLKRRIVSSSNKVEGRALGKESV